MDFVNLVARGWEAELEIVDVSADRISRRIS